MEAQAGALNKVLTGGAYAKPPQLVRPETWNQASAAVNTASRTFRDALSSSGKFTTQQIRATSEAERYTQAIQKQKLSLGEMIKHQGILKQVYQDQLRMQKMSAQYWGTDTQGRAVTDITMPTRVPQELDTWQRRMGFFGSLTKSAGKEIVNLGKNIQWSGRQLTVGLTYPMILFGAAAGKVAYDTEKGFANINKVYDLSAKSLTSQAAKEQELGQLRSRSLAMATTAAQQYGSTLNSTLKVEKELAATGLRGNQLLGTTQQVQRISTLGDMDPQQTTQMVVALQNTMLKGDKSTKHLADTLNYLNATANATSLDLQDIAESVPRAASAFHSLGGTTKDLATILVAMRESGVEAAQGANAIKSASTRIINPVKKAIDIYDQYGIDIQKISKESNGNLFEFLKKLGVEQQKIVGPTKKQTAYLRAQGIAALFGTYQYNRLNAALVNITDAYGGVNNQASKAIELGKRSPAELAKIAKASQDEMMNNPAGKLRQEWAALQIELSKMGVPFLKAGADILSVFTKITKAFNNMPGWIKKIALFGAAGLALAGPLVMLSGLVMNLFGQFFTGIGTIATMVAQFKQLSATWGEAGTIGQRLAGVGQIITKQERAAALTAEQQNKAYATQKAEIASLAEEVAVLTAAYERATIAAQAQMEVIGQIPSSASPAFIGPKTQVLAGHPLTSAEQTAAASIPTYIQGPNGRMAGSLTEAARLERIQAQVAADEKAAAAAAEAAAAANTKNSTALKTAGVASAAMAASMVLMMAPVGHVGQEIGKWGLIGTMAVPALKTAVGLGNVMVSRIAATTARIIAAARGTSLLTAGFAAARTGALGLGTAINAALGPVGWAALGITAIAGAFMYAKHRDAELAKAQQEIYDKQVKINNAMVNGARSFAESIGRATKSYDKLLNMGPDNVAFIGQTNTNMFGKAYDYYSKNKSQLSPFNTDDEEDLIDRLKSRYVDLRTEANLSAKQAMSVLEGILVAMGKSGKEAVGYARQVYTLLGGNDIKQNIQKALESSLRVSSRDLRKSLAAAGSDVYGLGNFNQSNAIGFDTDAAVEKYKKGLAGIQAQIKASGALFARAWNNALNPKDAKAAVDAYMNTALQDFIALYNKMEKNPALARFLANKGVTSGASLARAYDTGAIDVNSLNSYGLKVGNNTFSKDYFNASQLDASLQAAKATESAYIKAGLAARGLGKDVDTAAEATRSLAETGRMVSYQAAVAQAKELMRTVAGTKGGVNKGINDALSGFGLAESGMNATGRAANNAMNKINKLNAALGYAQGKNYKQAYSNLFNRVPADADAANRAIDSVKRKVAELPNSKVIRIGVQSLGAADVSGIMKSAMAATQDEMANSALASFNASWDSKEAATQAYWSKRQQAAQNAASNAQDRLQAKFEKREDRINKAYQKRIDAVNKEIKSEQDADSKRQAMYEAEKNRLQHLADMQNNNIDFQTAINEGRIDDAAKIENEAGAKNAAYQMDKEQAAAEERTKATVDRLERKNDRLEKQRDKELKQLEKMEDRQKKHLDRMQQAREAALERASNADMAAQKRQRDYEEAMLNQRLTLFKSYTGRNQADLEAWMRKVGLSYDDFGIDVKAKGKDWSKYFRTELAAQIHLAGMQIISDNMWTQIAKQSLTKMLKGFGLDNMTQFWHFAKTGKWPSAETHHTGGVVGSGSGSRGNVPDSFKGLHRSEQMVRAQKGEFVVNKDAAKRYGNVLSAINGGTYKGYDGIGGLNTAEVQMPIRPAIVGLTAGVAANMYKVGVSKGLTAGFKEAKDNWAKAARSGGGHVGGGYVPGAGGRHRPIVGPVTNGLHDQSTGYPAVDFAGPIGTPVYAVADGRITRSYDIRGSEPRRVTYGVHSEDGYRSYGRVIYLKTNAGPEVLYAHLSQRSVAAGKTVKGGAVLGRRGNTGNVFSTTGNGAHLHFGATNGPYAWLRQGGTVKYDNTPAVLHRGETVLTDALTQQFKKNVASGGGNQYTITVDLRGAVIKDEFDFKKAVNSVIDEREGRLGRKRVIR